MKKLITSILLACAMVVAPITFTGCGTPAARTTQGAGAVTISVESAMNSWGEWVRAGKAPVEDRINVRAAYIKYQQAMQVAEMAAIVALNAPASQPAYVTALGASSAASTDLVTLIQTLTKK
jgi:hypothetical protein